MMMGRLGVTLCVLLLVAAANAGRRKPHRQRTTSQLPSPTECSGVQSFDKGFKYHYEYETTIESRNNNTRDAATGKKIMCHDVWIQVPSNCTGTLSIKNCTVYEATLLQNGSLLYIPTNSNKLEKLLYKNKLYFHFNEGEIGTIFYDDRSEQTDILNIKRGMLSALQFKFNTSQVQSVNKRYEIPEVNIFGAGNSSVEIKSIESSVAKTVVVTRDLDQFELPWKRHQWTNFRSVLEGSDLADFVTDLIVEQSQNVTGNSSQSCEVTLERGRNVKAVECIERRPVNLYNNTFLQLLFGLNDTGNYTANTTVQLRMRQKNRVDMEHRDRPHRMELIRFQARYKEENLMFEEQWVEAMDSQAKAFSPVDAISILVTRPENRTTPTLFSKLARFVSRCSEKQMMTIWHKIETRYTGHELEKATNIWIQVLNGCNSSPYWCPLPQCEPNMGCQKVMSHFIDTTVHPQWSNSIRMGIIDAISTMPYPNATIIKSAVEICRTNTTTRTVMMLGKALARYVQHPDADLDHQAFNNSRNFLVELLNSNCAIQQGSVYYESMIKIAAMKSIGALGEHGGYARETLIRCAANHDAPKELSLNAIRSLQDIPFPPTDPMRQQLIEIVKDQTRHVTVRLASYLMIMTKEPTVEEIRTIFQIIVRLNEPRALKYYITEHIRSQIVLQNTSFCELSQSAVDNILTVAKEGHLNIDIDVTSTEVYSEKKYVTSQQIFLPIINKELDCQITSNLVFTQNSMVPILVNVTISTEMGDSNVTLLETKLDFSKIVAVLDPLFGDHGVFPRQELEKFLNMPISQLLKLVVRDEPLLSRNEIDTLTMIQDEGQLAYSMLMMKNKSPFEIKVLGVPINSRAITELPFMQSMNLLSMWKIVDTMEKGWSFEGVLADQPMLAHLASPTSMGSPHIFHLEAAYFVHMHSKITIPIQKIILTREGNVTVKSVPIIKGSVMWNQKIQMPLSLSCGTGYQLNAGHSSKVEGSIDIKRDHIKMDLEHLLPETEIISIKGDDIIVNNSKVIVVEPIHVCPRSCIWPQQQCSGNALYYKACYQPHIDLGVYYQQDTSKQYHFVMGWKLPQMQTQDSEEGVYNISLSSFNTWPSETPAWSMVGRYNPSPRSVRLEIESQQRKWIVVEANALVYRNERSGVPSLFNQMFASCNVSRPVEGSDRMELTSINKIFVRKEDRSENIVTELFGEFIDSEPQSEQNKVHYTIESDLQLNGDNRMSAQGSMLLNKTDGGYSVQMQVKRGALIDRSNRRICTVNVTSSRNYKENMNGFLTMLRVEEMSSEFPYPLTFLNQFSRFNFTLKDVNSTIGKNQHDMDLQAYVKGNPEPYFFNRYSEVNKLQDSSEDGPYIQNSTFTINWAQVQFDIISPNTSEIASVQRLVIPKTSIPHARFQQHQVEEMRISESDAQLKPTSYISKMSTGSFPNGTYYFKANTSKHESTQQQQMQPEQPYYSVDLIVMPSECPLCHNITVNVNGTVIKSEYANKTNWQGHSMSVDVHSFYLDMVPVSNKTKEIIRRYSSSSSSDKLKLGYIFKANQSEDAYFYEVGYLVGDKKLVLLTNLSLPSTEPSIINVRVNVTCEECLLLTDASFKTGLGFTYNATIPQKWMEQATMASVVDVAFDFKQVNGIEVGFGMYIDAVYQHYVMIDMATTANVSFAPNESFLKTYFSEPQYVYVTAMNFTRIQEGSQDRPTIFYVAYPISFYPGGPWMVGNWTSYQQTAQEDSEIADVCQAGETCDVYKVEFVQKDKCQNFNAFYESRQQDSPYKTVNCSYQTISLVMSPRNTHNFSFVFDGSNNPEFVAQKVVVKSVKDIRSHWMQNLTVELARHFYPSPMRLSANYSNIPRKQSEFQIAYESNEINSYVDKNEHRLLLANITTHRIPLEMNCTFTADLSQQEKTDIKIRNCSIYHPELTSSALIIDGQGWYKSLIDNKLKMSVTNSSDKVVEAFTNMQEGRGLSRVYCGQENDQQSPCNVTWSYNGDIFAVNARVNTSMLNHTTNASLSGLSSFNILDWTTNVNTSTSLRTESKQNCTHCQNSPSVISKYNFDTVISENNLELVRACVNSTYWAILRDSGSLYFHYMSNATTDIDVVMSTVYGKGMKLETGMYQGINQPQSKLYMPSESSADYLEAYYLKYIKCRRNTTLISKNLYNQREIRSRSLVQMNTTVRSNSWPISCNDEWRQIFKEMFPMTPITPFCAEDMELRVLYDQRKNNEVKVEVDKQEKPLMKVVYHKRNHVHNITAVCEDERNPTCHLEVGVSDKELSLNTSINSSALQHAGKVRVLLRPNNDNEQTIVFHMHANNTIISASQLMTFNATLNYTDEEGLFLYSKLNSTKDLDNVLLVQNGTIKELRMYGKSIMILSKPRSWNVSYINNTSVLEIVANVQLDPESQLNGAYYEGVNHPRAFVQRPVQTSDYYIKGLNVNYTTCGQHAHFKWNDVLTRKGGKQLIMQSLADIDMWPFQSKQNVLNYPRPSSCQLCVGGLELSTLYNATEDLELAIKVLLEKTSLFAINYTVGNEIQRPGYYASSIAELVYNVHEPSSPRMYLNSNASILSGQNCSLNLSVGRQGFKQNNFQVKQNFTYGPQSEWRHELMIDSEILSVSMDLQNEKNTTLVAVKYPYSSEEPLSFTLMLRNRELEINNLTFKTYVSEWHLKRMIFTVVKNELNKFGGLTMHDLDLDILTNLHYSQPDVITVSGNASAVYGENWFIEISDVGRQKFVISWRMLPTTVTKLRSFALIRLPFIHMDMDGNTTWSLDEFKNDINCSLLLPHPLTKRMLPIFHFLATDSLKKAQDCVYHGKMYWNANIWNPFYSTYHINPVLSVLLNPKTNSESDMNVNFTMGDYHAQSQMNFTHEMQKIIPIFRNLTFCVPRKALARAEARLPFWESNHTMDIEPKKYEQTTNATVLLRLPLMYVVKPIFNFTNTMKFFMTSDDLLVGSSMINGTVMTPRITSFKSDCTIVPVSSSGTPTRKFGCAYQVGDNQPLMFNISAPNSQNKRRVTARGFETDIFTSTLEITECALSLPLLPELLCMPREMQLRDINADIPVARILRQFPVLNIIVPDTELLNVVLRNSYTSMVTATEGDNWTVICKSRYSGPNWSQRISQQLSQWDLPQLQQIDQDNMSIWNFDTTITRTESQIDCIFDTTMKTPLIEDHIRFHWVPMFYIREIIFQVKTKGIIEEYIPIDVDWEYTNDPVHNNWTFAINSCQFKILDTVKGNVSFATDSSMKNSSLGWKLGFKHYPAMNHSVGVKLDQRNENSAWGLNAWISNPLVHINSSSSFGNFSCKLDNLTFGLPTTSKDLNITYQIREQDGHKLIVAIKDTETSRYICNGTQQSNGSLLWKCSKQQLHPQRGWEQREHHVSQQQIDFSPVGIFSMVKKIFSFNYTLAKSQKWIDQTLENVFGMSDQVLRARITKYVVNETEVIEQKIDNLLKITTLKSWNSWISDLLEIIPTLIPAGEYLNQTLGSLNYLSSDAIKMEVVSGAGYIAIRYNITSPKYSDVMMQMNLTTYEGYPIVNVSLFTPFSEQYMMLDLGPITRPLKVGVKSLTAQNRLQMNFTCPRAGESCATAEFMLVNERVYRCEATKQGLQQPIWTIVCHLIRQGQETEVSRFTVNSPSFIKTMKTSWYLTMHYMEGRLEEYMDTIMNIQEHSTFSNDLTKTVSDCYSNIKELCYMIFPENAMQLYQLENVVKEAAILGIQHIKQINNEGESVPKYQQLIQSGIKYLSAVNSTHIVKIPIAKLHLPFIDAEFYVELGKEDEKNVSFVLDTSVPSKPDLRQKLRADLWYEQNKPFVRCAINNNFVWSYMNVCLKNMSLVNASIGLPQSDNCMNVTYVGQPDASRKHYEIKFVDTEGSKYLCDMRQRTDDQITTNCHKQRIGERSTRAVCHFDTPIESLKPMQLLSKAGLMVPEMYVAAMKPTEFKDYLQRLFQVSDSESLELIASYLSSVCNSYIKRLHKDFIQFYANNVTDIPTLINDEWASKIVTTVMTQPRVVQIARGEQDIGQASVNFISDLAPGVITKTINTVNTVTQTCQEIQNIAWVLYDTFNTTFEPMTRTYSIGDFVNGTYNLIQVLDKINYVCHQVIFEPTIAPSAMRQLYREMYITEYLMSLFKLGGPVYEWTTGPRTSTVISFNQQTYELPLVDSNSECMYLHLTEPLRNSYNIISKGDSLLLVFPNITVEMAKDRRVYVTTQNSPRAEVTLPLFKNEVYCVMVQEDTVECKCMEYSVVLKTGSNERVRRTVTIYLPQYAMGVMGVQSDEPTPVSLFLPNGTEATNSAQLMNAYKLTQGQECQVSSQFIILPVTQHSNTCKPICDHLFAAPELAKIKLVIPKVFRVYYLECRIHCHDNNKTEACESVEGFVNHARHLGFKVDDVKECMSCSLNSKPIVLEKSEVYIVVSMSHDRIEADPRKSIRKLATRILDRMASEGLSDSKVGVITYGGEGNWSKPAMTAVRGLSVTTNRKNLLTAIQRIDFTGPDYNPATTVDALRFVIETLNNAPKGIAKCLLFVAPETEQKNCGRQDAFVENLRSDMTSVFLWSPMTNDQCQQYEPIVTQTEGSCISSTTGSEDQMTDKLINNLKQKIGNPISCQCQTGNRLTGGTKSQCQRSGDNEIQY